MKKKDQKIKDKTKEKESKVATSHSGRDKPTTPIKSVPKKKKKTEDEKSVLPVDLEELVRQVIIENKSKLSAEKIIELIRDDYRAVNDVTI